MAANCRRSLTQGDPSQSPDDDGRELFEACRNGDLNKVKKIVNTQSVNAKDTAGRKSSPLHFAAGKGKLSSQPPATTKRSLFWFVFRSIMYVCQRRQMNRLSRFSLPFPH